MKTFTAVAIQSVVVSLILGTPLTDPNLYELCSKQYFDRITTQEVGNRTVIKFYRKNEAKNRSIHKWEAFLDYKNTNISDLSYEMIEADLPELQLAPKDCHFSYDVPKGKDLKWDFKFKLENLESGPVIVNLKAEVYFWGSWKIKYLKDEEKTNISNSKNVWFTSLFCKISEQTIYVIGEDKSLMNGNKRTQFVRSIQMDITMIEVDKSFWDIKASVGTTWQFVISPTLHKLTNLKEFLSIDCSRISNHTSSRPTITDFSNQTSTPIFNITESIPTEEEETFPTVLWIILIVVFFLALILPLILLLVIHQRKQRKPESTTIETTVDSRTKSKSSGLSQL